MSGPQAANTQAWNHYGSHRLRKATTALAIPDTIRWGFGTAGPGTEVLGPLAGRRVLELGCGTGRYAAHLAHHHHAHVTGVESSPAQYQRAVSSYSSILGLTLVRADAVDYLQRADLCDVIISIHGALCYTPPPCYCRASSPRCDPAACWPPRCCTRTISATGHPRPLSRRHSDCRSLAKPPATVYRWVLHSRLVEAPLG